MFAINIAGIKLIQSFTKVILTVTTLTYVAAAAMVSTASALIPRGNP